MAENNKIDRLQQFYDLDSRIHRTVEVIVVSLIAFVGLETLIKVENLYQQIVYVKLSLAIYALLFIWMHFIFDLRARGRKPITSILRQLKERFVHFLDWNNFRHFQNYLILPGTIYWGSVVLIGINFQHLELQQTIAVASSVALVCAYAFFGKLLGKEITAENEIEFLILTYIKIYSAWLLFAGSLGITWYYCFPSLLYYLTVFMVSFILLYQVLFLYRASSFKNIVRSAVIAVVMAFVSIGVYHLWNVNYFTAGLFLTALYNFQWTLLFHSIRKTLTIQILTEQCVFLMLMLIMIFGITNFKERIDRCS